VSDIAPAPAVAPPPIPEGARVISGTIAARLDRLPLTSRVWISAFIAQFFYASVLSIDPLAARLYPVLWLPENAFNSFQYALLVGFENGLGVLIGQVLITYLSDRLGRKPMMIVSCLIASAFTWPIAYTSNWPLLMVLVTVAAIGVGGALGLANVYTVEIAPPAQRSRLTLGSQIVAAVGVSVIASLLPVFLLPAHYVLFVWIVVAIPIVITVPLIALVLRESPRWLEARGRIDEADRIVSEMERIAEKKGPLAEPEADRYKIVQEEGRVPVREVFQGIYLRRSVVLLLVWTLGYLGLDYGYSSFASVYLIQYYPAATMFLVTFIGSLVGTLVMTVLGAILGERVERKTFIFVAGLMSFAGGVIYFLFPTNLPLIVLGTILASGAILTWAFNGYSYTAASYPTRLRATASGFTDGVGHLGAVAGPVIAAAFYAQSAGINHLSWFIYFGVFGGLLPGIIALTLGMRQRGAVLEEISR
jgi:MFS family permease